VYLKLLEENGLVKQSQLLGLLAIILTVLGTAGCKSTTTLAANPQIRVMNAAVQQPTITAKLSATTLAANLAFPTASAYASPAPGGYTLHVEVGTSLTPTTLINLPLVLQPGASYTFIAAEAAFASPALTPIVLTDDNTTPASGQMKLRLVNASPDIGNLDIYVVAPGASIQNKTATVSNLAFKSASSYQSLAAGSYEIYFTAAGQKTVLVDSGKLSFQSGQIRTVVALDDTGGYITSVLTDVH
jgi:hypothetical protein